MSTLPSISVVMPSYNQQQFVRPAMDSVLSQNYPALELIVVDGASTDGTVDILKEYSGRIRYLSEPDRGQCAALNKGFHLATGEIIGWLNADDLYERGALRAVGEFFAAHPGTQWAFGYCSIINEENKEIRKWVTRYKNFRLARYRYRTLLTENYISQMGVFVRRTSLLDAGGVNPAWHYAMDYDLWLRLGKQYEPGFIAAPLGKFRMYSTTKSITGFHRQFTEELEVAKKYAPHAFWPIFLHRVNRFKIVLIYEIMALWRSLKKGNQP